MRHGNASDRRFAITTQFSAHASTTALSRSVDKGLVVIEAGAIEDAPFTVKGEQPKKTMTITREVVIMCVYSPRKNRANFMPLYSVW